MDSSPGDQQGSKEFPRSLFTISTCGGGGWGMRPAFRYRADAEAVAWLAQAKLMHEAAGLLSGIADAGSSRLLSGIANAGGIGSTSRHSQC